MQNVVFFLDNARYPQPEFKSYSLASWEHWCEKNGVSLIKYEKFFDSRQDTPPRWQRFNALKALEQLKIAYDKVAVVSPFTLIQWDCPNFFLDCDERLGLAIDWDCPSWAHRSIEALRPAFDNVPFEWDEFHDDGVFVVNKQHEEICARTLHYLYSLNDNPQFSKLLVGSESHDRTVFNLAIKKHGINIKRLKPRFNITQPGNRYALDNNAYQSIRGVWQFNNMDHGVRNEEMKKFWSLKQ